MPIEAGRVTFGAGDVHLQPAREEDGKENAMRPITFSTGIPDFDSLILVEGHGLGQLRSFHEDGTVDVYMGARRTFRLPGSARWSYAKKA